MIINTIIDHYHNIKINTKGNLIIAPVTWVLQLNHLQFYPPNIFFHSRPLFVIWYRNQKERKHADHAAFEENDVAWAFFKYSSVKVVDTALALFKIMQATRLEMHHLKNSLNPAGDHL